MNFLRWLILTIWLLPLAQASAPSDPLVIEADQVVDVDVATFTRPIVVHGHVQADVTSVFGAIEVFGQIDGDVVSYAGAITLAPTARVGGSVLSFNLTPAVAADDQVVGRALRRELFTEGGWTPVAIIAFISGLALALTAIWPRRVTGMALAFAAIPWRSALLGALALVLLMVLGGLGAAFMATSVVTLPLVPLWFTALQLPFVPGAAALGRWVAQQIAIDRRMSIWMATFSGLLIVALPCSGLALLSPLLGMSVFYLGSAFGLGVALLSRFGAFAPRPNLP